MRSAQKQNKKEREEDDQRMRSLFGGLFLLGELALQEKVGGRRRRNALLTPIILTATNQSLLVGIENRRTEALRTTATDRVELVGPVVAGDSSKEGVLPLFQDTEIHNRRNRTHGNIGYKTAEIVTWKFVVDDGSGRCVAVDGARVPHHKVSWVETGLDGSEGPFFSEGGPLFESCFVDSDLVVSVGVGDRWESPVHLFKVLVRSWNQHQSSVFWSTVVKVEQTLDALQAWLAVSVLVRFLCLVLNVS